MVMEHRQIFGCLVPELLMPVMEVVPESIYRGLQLHFISTEILVHTYPTSSTLFLNATDGTR